MNFETSHIDYKDSAMGKMEQTYKEQAEKQLIELQKLRQEFDQYRADQATYCAEQDRILHAERFRNTIVSAIIGFATASLANLLVYYWPSIVSAVECLLHG